jgi:hypothetical protein
VLAIFGYRIPSAEACSLIDSDSCDADIRQHSVVQSVKFRHSLAIVQPPGEIGDSRAYAPAGPLDQILPAALRPADLHAVYREE